MKFEVKLFKRKEAPDLTSEKVKIGRREVPKDTIPVEVKGFTVGAKNVDQARSKARKEVSGQGRRVTSISVSAARQSTLLVYFFERTDR